MSLGSLSRRKGKENAERYWELWTVSMKDLELLTEILKRLRVVRGPDLRGEYLSWCIFHPDGKGNPPHNPNLQVSVRGFFCHACQEKGSLSKLAIHLGISTSEGSDVEKSYDYQDEEGKLLFQVVRLTGKRFFQRRPDGKGGWIKNLEGVRRVLYRLPNIVGNPNAKVFLPEGEKDADRLASEGVIATTNPGGAGKWRAEYSMMLGGRNVVFLPDNDDPGRKHAEQVAGSLVRVAKTVRVLELPGLSEKGDVSDWLDAGHTVEELVKLANEAPQWKPAKEKERPKDGKEQKTRISLTDILISRVLGGRVELFHDERCEPYAAVEVPEGRTILPLDSKKFVRLLSYWTWKTTGNAAPSEVLTSVRQILGGIARYEKPKHPLHVRCARFDEAIWLDLDGFRAVRVTPGKWEIIDKTPILFRWFPHQKPLPEPIPGGDPKLVLRFLNLRDRDAEVLFLAYLVVGLVPDIPVVALVVHGIQGSAKTTLLKVVKRQIDPSAVEVRGGVRDLTEFAQAAWQNRVLFFDNLSRVPGWLSDALCRTVTGEGWSKRTLYTDEDSTVFEYRRMVGLAGINLVADQPDLLDRSIILPLESIPRERRKEERTFWSDFDQARPQILGGLLDALAKAMEIEPQLIITSRPRMADFARWGAAASEALGKKGGEFLSAYDRNVGRQNEAAVDASLVAQAVLEFMKDQPEWEGPPGELLEHLNSVAEALRIDTRVRNWPKDPSWVSRRLREVLQNLSAMGVEVLLGGKNRTGFQRRITLRKVRKNAVIAVTGVTSGSEIGSQRDGIVTGKEPEEEDAVTDAVTGKPRIHTGSDSNDGNDTISGASPGGTQEADSETHAPEREGWVVPDPDGTTSRIEGSHEPGLLAMLERAAIMEFDGGMSREEAERLAGFGNIENVQDK